MNCLRGRTGSRPAAAGCGGRSRASAAAGARSGSNVARRSFGGRPDGASLAPGADGLEQGPQGRLGAERALAVAADDQLDPRRGLEPLDELAGALDLRPDDVELGGDQSARPAAGPRRDVDLRALRGLDDQRPRGDQARQLGVAELLEQAEDVAVDRLLPDARRGRRSSR